MLREVKASATYTVTDHGEPVAEIAPIRRQRWVSSAEVNELLQELGADDAWLREIAAVSSLSWAESNDAAADAKETVCGLPLPRSGRAIDLIAATAPANGASILTRNPNDFVGIEGLVPILLV